MQEFFSLSYKETQLKIAHGEKYLLEQRIVLLENDYEKAVAQVQVINDALQKAKSRQSGLQAQVQFKQGEIEEISTRLSSLQQERGWLDKDHRNIKGQFQQARTRREEIASSIHALQQEAQELRQQIEAVEQRIGQLEAVINQPEPRPHYITTGATCINGHVNCPKLPLVNPGKTELANEEEIRQHRAAVEQAIKERNQLENDKFDLISKSNSLQDKITSLEYEELNAQNDCWQYEAHLREQEQKLEENRQLQAEAIIEQEIKQAELADLQCQARQTQEEVDSLMHSSSQAEFQTAQAKDTWLNAQLELQRLTERINDLEAQIWRQRQFSAQDKLIALAEQEIAQQDKGSEPNLLALALQELEIEGKDFLQGTKNIYESVKVGVQQVQEVVKETRTTIMDVWPSAGIMQTKLLFNKIESTLEAEKQEMQPIGSLNP